MLRQMSRCIRKRTICICENKDADQLCSNCTADYCTADQRLCFRYTDSTIPLLLKSEISSFQPSSVTVQADLCQTWLESQIVGFLMQCLLLTYVETNRKLQSSKECMWGWSAIQFSLIIMHFTIMQFSI